MPTFKMPSDDLLFKPKVVVAVVVIVLVEPIKK